MDGDFIRPRSDACRLLITVETPLRAAGQGFLSIRGFRHLLFIPEVNHPTKVGWIRGVFRLSACFAAGIKRLWNSSGHV